MLIAWRLSFCHVRYHGIQSPGRIRMSPIPSSTTVDGSRKKTRLTRTQRTALLKALADPKRFELLERISRATCPLACAAAGEELAISPATLSHHIKELQTSGL